MRDDQRFRLPEMSSHCLTAAPHEVLDRFGAGRIAVPDEPGRRSALSRTEIPLPQARIVLRDTHPEPPGKNTRGLGRPRQIAGNDPARPHGGAAQGFRRCLSLSAADLVQRHVLLPLDDAQMVRAGPAVPEEQEGGYGRRIARRQPIANLDNPINASGVGIANLTHLPASHSYAEDVS